jgi:hypothetical protein
MDRDSARAWLDRYVEAWKSYDRDDVGALFAADVVYRYHPHADPVVGRDAVVASWLGESDATGVSTRDAAGTYDAHYAPYAVDEDRMVAIGTSVYQDHPDGPVTRTFDNCFLIRFDHEGRCLEFTEFYKERAR